MLKLGAYNELDGNFSNRVLKVYDPQGVICLQACLKTKLVNYSKESHEGQD